MDEDARSHETRGQKPEIVFSLPRRRQTHRALIKYWNFFTARRKGRIRLSCISDIFWQTSSTLVTVTTSSTLLTAVISTCIPATQFATGAANVACVRRRRDIFEMMDFLGDDKTDVSPTQVQKFVQSSTIFDLHQVIVMFQCNWVETTYRQTWTEMFAKPTTSRQSIPLKMRILSLMERMMVTKSRWLFDAKTEH